MRVLIVLYYYHPYVSGLSLLTKMLAEGLASRGHHVTVLTTQHDGTLARSEVVNGVQIIRAKILAKISKGVLSVDLLQKMVKLSKTHDIVNPHLPMAHFGFVLPFIDTNKLVTQYHCDLNLGCGALTRLIQQISYWSMGRTLHKSAKIVVTTKDYFSSSRFAKYAGRVSGIYPPIDHNRFVQRDSTEMRAKLEIDMNTKLIGFVGRVVAEKGLEYLLRAIPLLESRLDNFMVLIAGEHTKVAGGSVRQDIGALIEKYPDRVKLVGHLKFDDLVTFYSLIDVLILPSVDPLEAFGMVQVEAMLCGTPVIASDMPGVREVIRKTGFGRLVNKRDPKDIADKIVELLVHPIVIDENRLACFNYDRVLDHYEDVLSDQILVDQNGPQI